MSTCADNTHLRGAGGEVKDDGQDRTRRADDDGRRSSFSDGVTQALARGKPRRRGFNRSAEGWSDIRTRLKSEIRERFTFERAVPGGSADAYLEGCFGWEFKGAEAQLPGAFEQLLRYQVYLRTPPLLVVSSFQTDKGADELPGQGDGCPRHSDCGVGGSGAVRQAAGHILRTGGVRAAAHG